MSDTATNQQLRELLKDLGFAVRDSVEPRCLVFEHPQSQARLLLPSNKDNEVARSADILSLRTHLIARGHLTAESLNEFLQSGRLRAS